MIQTSVLEFVQKPHVCIETDGLRLLVIIRQQIWNILEKEDSAQQSKKIKLGVHSVLQD